MAKKRGRPGGRGQRVQVFLFLNIINFTRYSKIVEAI